MSLHTRSLSGFLVLGCFGSILILCVHTARSATLAPDLQKFVGTWQGQFKGKTFMLLKLGEQSAKLGGTVIHTTHIDSDSNGSILNVDITNTEDRVLEAQAAGDKLILKITNNGDQANPVQCELALTAKNKGVFRMVVAPPRQLKPWNVERISTVSR
jgi:hypothetical protein